MSASIDNTRVLANDAPMTLAREFLVAYGKDDGELTLRYWSGDFYQWSGGTFSVAPTDELNGKLWGFLGGLRTRSSRTGKPTRYVPTQARVDGVIAALKAETQVYQIKELPAWLDTSRPLAVDIIAFKNGLLNVKDWIKHGQCMLRPPSPLWFSTNVLPYDFQNAACCPRWLAFLEQVFDADQERIALLQEWMGYLITSDMSQQKLLLLIGPPRSGKGTITRVVERLLGSSNVVWPSLPELGERFGLASLLGKSAAIVADAHLTRDANSARLVETLKTISGEDPVYIDRKNRDGLTNVRLGVRFMICSNELPQLSDASSALSTRLLLLRMPHSFAGREDRTLDAALQTETSGVMRWALDGLVRLRGAGSFTQPHDSVELAAEFEHLSSPLKAFVDDCCELGDFQTPIAELYEAYRKWASDNGRNVLAQANFGVKLRAAANTKRVRQRDGVTRKWCYAGIRLSSPYSRSDDLARMNW